MCWTKKSVAIEVFCTTMVTNVWKTMRRTCDIIEIQLDNRAVFLSIKSFSARYEIITYFTIY